MRKWKYERESGYKIKWELRDMKEWKYEREIECKIEWKNEKINNNKREIDA
jgi:hypothetical protein